MLVLAHGGGSRSGRVPPNQMDTRKVPLEGIDSPPRERIPMVFTDDPIFREFSDSYANELAADYFSGTVSVTPLPVLRITQSGENVVLSWPSSATGFLLQEFDFQNPETTWNAVPASAGTNGAENVVTLPLSGTNMLYRLYKK
jgi:hypothetical protein